MDHAVKSTLCAWSVPFLTATLYKYWFFFFFKTKNVFIKLELFTWWTHVECIFVSTFILFRRPNDVIFLVFFCFTNFIFVYEQLYFYLSVFKLQSLCSLRTEFVFCAFVCKPFTIELSPKRYSASAVWHVRLETIAKFCILYKIIDKRLRSSHGHRQTFQFFLVQWFWTNHIGTNWLFGRYSLAASLRSSQSVCTEMSWSVLVRMMLESGSFERQIFFLRKCAKSQRE